MKALKVHRVYFAVAYAVCHCVICVVDCGVYMGSNNHIHELDRLYTQPDRFKNVHMATWRW